MTFSIIDYFENKLKEGDELLSNGYFKQAVMKYYLFMEEIMIFFVREWCPEIHRRAPKYGGWHSYWQKEREYGLEVAYHAIRKEFEKRAGQSVSQSFALAWKSAKELKKENIFECCLYLDKETIYENIDNIRCFWNKIKDFIENEKISGFENISS